MRNYKGQFEVHITADTPSELALVRFQDWCGVHSYKCVRIVLARGSHMEQPMATWRGLDTMLPAAVTETEKCALEMKSAEIHVVRVKIEASLANEEIPLHDAEAKEHPAENYFEHHIKLLRLATASSKLLLDACEKCGAHLSRNAFREVPDGQQERFVTLRSYGVGRMSSEMQLQQLLNVLQGLQEQIIGCESEYCVYDTNVNLDAGWLRKLM